MSEETISTNTVKAASDGSVKIAVEKYNELLETIADQKGSISGLNERLNRALREPPVINRTVINKTAEMAARDNRTWGGTFIALGASMFAVGVVRYKAGRTGS
jgi:hypothetical protein